MLRYKLGRCHLDSCLNRAGMTRQQLGERAGYSRQQISDWATGFRIMTLETAITIAMVIGCGVFDLYEIIANRTN